MGIDDTDNPTIMEDLLWSLGAEIVDFSFKQKCCGSYITVNMKKVVADLSYKILENARLSGAEILVTACPLCEYNLGPRQDEIQKHYSEFDLIPVVYFTQIMALAFGLNDEAMAFENNKPDPRPLLKKKGLIVEEKN
jgi:heterodisulfide reductase subunit B